MAWLMMLGGGRQPRCLKEEKAASGVGTEGAGVQKDKSCEFPKERIRFKNTRNLCILSDLSVQKQARES